MFDKKKEAIYDLLKNRTKIAKSRHMIRRCIENIQVKNKTKNIEMSVQSYKKLITYRL